MDEPPLSPELLVRAYAQGYFPMPHPDTGEILWLTPNPRAVIPLDGFHASRSLRKTLRTVNFEITVDQDFRGVMVACGDREDTWITDEFKRAYGELHDLGFAHSLEVWQDGALAGGVYGVSLNGAFFAESMFHKVTDASKVALYHLVARLKERGFKLLEVQFLTPHLASLGAVEIAKVEYLRRLRVALATAATFAG
jgi:leucyl/phenylalanyl-tRNA--protein transferase